MVRILYDNQGRKEYAVGPDDLDFFGEVMGRVMRPQLTSTPTQAFQPLPEPVFLPAPAPAQRLLMPSLEALPEPHPAIMPQPAPRPLTVDYQTRIAPGPVMIQKPSPVQIAIALAKQHQRHLAIAGLSLVGGVFIWFAGSFVVRQVKPDAAVEEAPVEAIEGESAPVEAPAEEAAPAVNTPTFSPFPAIPGAE